MTAAAPPRPAKGVFTLRLGNSERRLLEAAAAERREFLAEYIRRTALEAARHDLVEAAG